MEKETCRTCKFSCRWCISKVNPEKYSFYCTKFGDMYYEDKKCGCYQIDGRYEE